MVAPPNLYDGTYTGGYEAWCFVRFMLRGLGPVILYYITMYNWIGFFGKHLYRLRNSLNGIRPSSSTDAEPAHNCQWIGTTLPGGPT